MSTKMRLTSIVATGLVVLALAGPAWAAETVFLQGKVVEIQGATFTIATRHHDQQKVVTNANTVFRIPGVKDPGIDDLQVGQHVLVKGQQSGQGNLIADLVAVLPRDAHLVRGIVTGIEGSTIVLRTGQGTLNVLTDESTVFRIPGVEDSGIDDIHLGDGVLAAGRLDDQGNLLAAAVAVRPQAFQRFTVRGKVTRIDGPTLLVESPHGEQRIFTTDETRYRIPGVEDPGLDDIQLGELIVAAGDQKGQEGIFEAKLIAVVPHRLRELEQVRGRVAAIQDTTLTLDTDQGSITILSDEHTRYRIPGVEDPGLDDIQVGDFVLAVVQRDASGHFLAKGIGVLRDRPDRGDRPHRPLRPGPGSRVAPSDTDESSTPLFVF